MFLTAARDVHLHLFSRGAAEVRRMLRFRDRLRASALDRLRYERVKRELAQKQWPDMNAYAQAKTRVIEEFLKADDQNREGVESKSD